MTGKKSLVELGLSLGFKIADPNSPIYKEGLTISVNPLSDQLEKQSDNREKNPSSPSEQKK